MSKEKNQQFQDTSELTLDSQNELMNENECDTIVDEVDIENESEEENELSDEENSDNGEENGQDDYEDNIDSLNSCEEADRSYDEFSDDEQMNSQENDGIDKFVDESEDDSVQPMKGSTRILKELFEWIKVIIIAFVLALLINKFILFSFTVPTESMENTIMTDSKVMSLRCAYWFSKPDRLDIVVFPFPDYPNETYIKRIIGLPGETIEGKDGLVYINGVPLQEDYVTSDLDEDFGPYIIPEDSYFVLGDNRDMSKDARYWDNKFVKEEDIISKAVFIFSPKMKILK